MRDPASKVTAVLSVLLCICDLIACPPIEDECENMICSNVYDPVCGGTLALDGSAVVKRFHNICHYNKIRCRFKSIRVLEKVPDSLCNIESKNIQIQIGRRIYDYSIVGAHQACNHTCPTYCTDIYDPACAQIWESNMVKYHYRPMINHCHIDLYSCVFGVNVTIQPLIGKCYKNPSTLNFMFNVASLKTLKLLDEPPPPGHSQTSRRFNFDNTIETKELNDFIDMLL